MSLLTSTMEVAGRIGAKYSPWTRPTSSQRLMSVTNMRVRTTSSSRAPTCSRASWIRRSASRACLRDVSYDEDRSQVRAGSGPQVMATLRNTAISLHRRAGQANIARACRRLAANPHGALNLVLQA